MAKIFHFDGDVVYKMHFNEVMCENPVIGVFNLLLFLVSHTSIEPPATGVSVGASKELVIESRISVPSLQILRASRHGLQGTEK